ncbi:MAG: hypothetical protein C0433_01670 [Cyclobacterium sp.]|nr:hypothetical protein [Cyclobacterium sp.]
MNLKINFKLIIKCSITNKRNFSGDKHVIELLTDVSSAEFVTKPVLKILHPSFANHRINLQVFL